MSVPLPKTIKDPENRDRALHRIGANNSLLFSFDSTTHAIVRIDGGTARVLGAQRQTLLNGGGLLLNHIAQSDRFRVVSELESALRGDSEFHITYRWVRPDSGKTVVVLARGELNLQTELFEGEIIPLGSALDEIGGYADSLEAVGSLLPMIGDTALVLTADLVIRAMFLGTHAPALSLGKDSFDSAFLQEGEQFVAAFSSVAAQEEIVSIFDAMLKHHEQTRSFSVLVQGQSFTSSIYVLGHRTAPEGFLVRTISKQTELEALQRCDLLSRQLDALRPAQQAVERVADLLDSIGTHSAIAAQQPQVGLDPLLSQALRHISRSAREGSVLVDRLVVPVSSPTDSSFDTVNAAIAELAHILDKSLGIPVAPRLSTHEFTIELTRAQLEAFCRSCEVVIRPISSKIRELEITYASPAPGRAEGLLVDPLFEQSLSNFELKTAESRLHDLLGLESDTTMHAFPLCLEVPQIRNSFDALATHGNASRVLVIGNSDVSASALAGLFNNAGLSASTARSNQDQILEILQQEKWLRVCIFDVSSSSDSVRTLSKSITRASPHIRVLALVPESWSAAEQNKLGAHLVVRKPIVVPALITGVRSILALS